MRRRLLHRVPGITLLEMLVALTVLGVVLAVAAPAMGEMVERQHLRGVASELSTDLRLARTEAVRRGAAANNVVLMFGGNSNMTCYSIITALNGSPANCDCTRTPGNVCQPAGARLEIKTVQVLRGTGVALSASSPTAANMSFQPPLGISGPVDMRIDVTGNHGQALRLRPNPAGSVAQCSPGGSLSGVPAC